MVDEHFGINVVEFMVCVVGAVLRSPCTLSHAKPLLVAFLWQAAGLIPLSHASAGPLLDIAVPVDGKPTGKNGAEERTNVEEKPVF